MFQSDDVFELLSAQKLAACIDRLSEPEGEIVPILAEAFDSVAFIGGSVAFAETAKDVEALQGEAGRVDLLVATGTGWLRTMLIKLLTNRCGSTRIGLDGARSVTFAMPPRLRQIS